MLRLSLKLLFTLLLPILTNSLEDVDILCKNINNESLECNDLIDADLTTVSNFI